MAHRRLSRPDRVIYLQKSTPLGPTAQVHQLLGADTRGPERMPGGVPAPRAGARVLRRRDRSDRRGKGRIAVCRGPHRSFFPPPGCIACVLTEGSLSSEEKGSLSSAAFSSFCSLLITAPSSFCSLSPTARSARRRGDNCGREPAAAVPDPRRGARDVPRGADAALLRGRDLHPGRRARRLRLLWRCAQAHRVISEPAPGCAPSMRLSRKRQSNF